MSYRSKTPTIISILTRRLKPGKSFEDFQKAHVPGINTTKTEFGYDTEFFGVPTRVINSIAAEDPSIIYSIGMSYGGVTEIFSEGIKGSSKDAEESARGSKLDEICDDIGPPIITFVGSDNNYGGAEPDYHQKPLANITEEVTQAIKQMLSGWKK